MTIPFDYETMSYINKMICCLNDSKDHQKDNIPMKIMIDNQDLFSVVATAHFNGNLIE